MTRRYNRVAFLLLVCFGAVAISLAYWSVFEVDGMLSRNDNPRRVEAEWAIQRGALISSDNQILASAVRVGVSPSGFQLWNRQYKGQEWAGALGYYSRFVGSGGAERAFDDILSGADQRIGGEKVLAELLNRPQIGRDVRLTLNTRLQETLAATFTDIGGKTARGGAILVEVPSGAVRAMVSFPVYDASQLDREAWNRLRIDPANPLRNRVLEGVYQPGGALETILLSAALTDNKPLTATDSTFDAPVQIDGLRIPCLTPPAPMTSLQDAYSSACPTPFVGVVNTQAATVQAMIDAFGLLKAPTLYRFVTVSGIGARTITPIDKIKSLGNLQAAAVGQGELAVTPLQMASVAAVIANDGNSIPLHMGDALRAAGSGTNGDFQPMTTPMPAENAVITQAVSAGIRAAMLQAVTSGAARAAAAEARKLGLPDGATLYGHVSLAYASREITNAWFIGFVRFADGRSVVCVVILENTGDVNQAAIIGGRVLAAAAAK